MHLKMGLSGCFIGLFLLSCKPVFSAEESEVDAAINRGLAWVIAHPATCQDGGLPDIVDEGLFYLTVKRLSSNKTFESLYEQAFEDCISRLEASPEFERRLKKQNKALIEHYYLLLATYLIETVRKPTASHDSIVAKAQRTLAINYSENPTFRLTVALLLQHLGATSQVSMDELLDASLINRVAQRDVLPFSGKLHNRSLFQYPLAYYALVHEVAALTDFGRLPVSPWLVERRSHIGRILQDGSRQAMMSSHVDLLAEIILCNHMLGLPITGELRLGVDFLIASQRADGSWGEQVTHRANSMRHAVLTATAALLAYKTSKRVY
jgi:hypothetical protein